jgi:uncharacterized membrane protein
MRRLLTAISVLGLGIALYLTAIHFTSVPLACPSAGIVDCASVLGSPYATIAGVPVSAFGVLWFAVLLLLARRSSPLLRPWVWIGAAVVVVLVYTELFVVGAVCLWCSAVHVLVLGSVAVVELGSRRAPA